MIKNLFAAIAITPPDPMENILFEFIHRLTHRPEGETPRYLFQQWLAAMTNPNGLAPRGFDRETNLEDFWDDLAKPWLYCDPDPPWHPRREKCDPDFDIPF